MPDTSVHLYVEAKLRRQIMKRYCSATLAACGNGSFHVKSSPIPEKVTCVPCKEFLERNKEYYAEK